MSKRISVVALILVGALMSFAYAQNQPHMQQALQSLQSAKSELDKASHSKGGHRAKAIELINQAIAEVKAGIDYDNTH